MLRSIARKQGNFDSVAFYTICLIETVLVEIVLGKMETIRTVVPPNKSWMEKTYYAVERIPVLGATNKKLTKSQVFFEPA